MTGGPRTWLDIDYQDVNFRIGDPIFLYKKAWDGSVSKPYHTMACSVAGNKETAKFTGHTYNRYEMDITEIMGNTSLELDDKRHPRFDKNFAGFDSKLWAALKLVGADSWDSLSRL